jgi:hypothetical protein
MEWITKFYDSYPTGFPFLVVTDMVKWIILQPYHDAAKGMPCFRATRMLTTDAASSVLAALALQCQGSLEGKEAEKKEDSSDPATTSSRETQSSGKRKRTATQSPNESAKKHNHSGPSCNVLHLSPFKLKIGNEEKTIVPQRYLGGNSSSGVYQALVGHQHVAVKFYFGKPVCAVEEANVLLDLQAANCSRIPSLEFQGTIHGTPIIATSPAGVCSYDQYRKCYHRRCFRGKALAKFVVQEQEALAAMHSAGYVHYDVKPSNFVRLEDGSTVLIDFEGARKLGAFVHQMLYTRKYCPRSVHRTMLEDTNDLVCGEDDLESLIYSIWELGAGKLPWQGVESDAELANLKHAFMQRIERRQVPYPLHWLLDLVTPLATKVRQL